MKSRVRSRFQSVRVSQVFTEPSLTDQSMVDETDLNVIIDRALRGQTVRQNLSPPVFGDFSEMPTLEEAFLIVQDARESFMTLPAKLRKLIDNDPRRITELTREDYAAFGLIVPKEPVSLSEPRAEAFEPAAGKPSKKAKESSDE